MLHIDLVVSNALHAKSLKIKETLQILQSIQALEKILYKILLVCLNSPFFLPSIMMIVQMIFLSLKNEV